MSHRISKKQLKRDEFAEDMVRTINFLKRYSTEALAVAIGLLVIAVGLVLISQNRAKSEQQAGLMLNSAHGALMSGNLNQAQEAYQEIVKRYGSTSAGQEARVYLGNLYFQKRDFTQASAAYQECLKTRPGNPLLLYAALSGLAACLEQEGAWERAGERYSEIASRIPKEEYLASLALMQAGRCFTEAGRMDRARACYQQIVDRYPGAGLYPEAKTAIQMLPNS